jgi:hypothetical protein
MEQKPGYNRHFKSRIKHIKEKSRCEAKTHNPSCPCSRCQKPKESCRDCNQIITKQHRVPQRFARNLLGWTNKQINAASNIQLLSEPCHQDADRNLDGLGEALKREQNSGKKITAEEILIFREFYS